MPEPLVFITTHAVADGRTEAIAQLGERFAAHVEALDLPIAAFHFHLSEDGREVTNVQLHESAASMDAYLPAVQDLIGEALELSSTTTIDVLGAPGPTLREVLSRNAANGARVRIRPRHVAGFTRGMGAPA